jgi:hypothetical protein
MFKQQYVESAASQPAWLLAVWINWHSKTAILNYADLRKDADQMNSGFYCRL